jgi:hypothetical protein
MVSRKQNGDVVSQLQINEAEQRWVVTAVMPAMMVPGCGRGGHGICFIHVDMCVLQKRGRGGRGLKKGMAVVKVVWR